MVPVGGGGRGGQPRLAVRGGVQRDRGQAHAAVHHEGRRPHSHPGDDLHQQDPAQALRQGGQCILYDVTFNLSFLALRGPIVKKLQQLGI